MAAVDNRCRWPDHTGFYFDLSPTDAACTPSGQYFQHKAKFYGTKHVDIDPNASGYKTWTNWVDKFEPDVRFAAVSDKNAHLYGFPEVDAPWKFTEYIYRGVGGTDSFKVIEPQLYAPTTLCQINDVTVGTISGSHFAYARQTYKYKSAETGNVYTEDELNTKGWCEPSGTQRFTFTVDDVGEQKFVFYYPTSNSGVRMYDQYCEVECVRWGQHGNIPPYTLNMAGPKEYFEPSNLYSNVVVPHYSATIGSPVFATCDGIITYHGQADWRGLNRITIASTTLSEVSASGTRFAEFEPSPSGTETLQPKPRTTKSNILKLKFVASKYDTGDFVHKGCAFFKGDNVNHIKCTIAAQLGSGDKPNVVDKDKCTFYSEVSDVKGAYVAASGKCPYYAPGGPQEIALYEAMASNATEWAEMYTTIDNYNWYGGANNLANGGAILAGTSLPVAGPTLMMAGFSFGAMSAFAYPQISEPREPSDLDLRWSVTYDFQKIPAMGREIYNDRGIYLKFDDFKQYLRGTGRFAIDDYASSPFGGIDTHFFGDRNMMSAWRWHKSILPCYNAAKCNSAYGHQMVKGFIRGKYSNTGSEQWCRYYRSSCPFNNVPRGAYEYDRNYVHIRDVILPTFRRYGMDGFDGLTEYEINSSGELVLHSGEASGVYVAAGANNLYDLDTIHHSASGVYIYFYYNISRTCSDHTNSDVFAHIVQYDYNGNQLTRSVDASGVSIIPSGYPASVPWLVMIEDDYVSPDSFAQFVTNEKQFFGGRNPEYKDRSKMDGTEIFGTAAAGGGPFDYTNGGKGGDPKYSYEDKGYGMGYWIMEYGEHIMDNRPLGELAPSGYVPTGYTITSTPKFKIVDIGARLQKKPDMNTSATPIAGKTANTFITDEMTRSARVSMAYIYSSDTRDILGCTEMTHLEDQNGKHVGLPGIPTKNLPTEREYYRCPVCASGYIGMSMARELTPSGTMPRYPWVNQIYIDSEKTSLGNKCMVCDSELTYEGNWTHFPNVYARGIVSVWGLPGDIVRTDGYFWKNPTIINRGFVSQIVGKLGTMNSGGFGYTLGATTSATGGTEESVARYPTPSGNYLRPGLPEPSGSPFNTKWDSVSFDDYTPLGSSDTTDKDDTITGTMDTFSRDDGAPEDGFTQVAMSGVSDSRLDGGTYDDRIISPYDSDIAGLDMFTITHMKNLRNRIAPMYGIMVGRDMAADYYPTMQESHRNRYGKEVQRKIYQRAGRLYPQIIAANSGGADQWSQYWDGKFPGTCVREYYPTGPTWWRINSYIGGISRSGGISTAHLDNVNSNNYTTEFRYTGNKLVSKAFFFLHGWVPLDKEIVKAYAIITPVDEPSKPPIGVVFSGRNIEFHYHPFRTLHESAGLAAHYDAASDEKEQAVSPEWIDDYDGYADVQWDSEAYKPYMHNYTSDTYAGTMQYIKSYWDGMFGFDNPRKTWAGTLKWNGIGTDLVQAYTEEQLWKTKTFSDFQQDVRKDLMKCKFVAGEEGLDGVGYHFSMFSRRFLDNYVNNEIQPIPGYFDLSGMNDRLMYPKTGPVYDEKVSDTSWAEGGQVIIQSADGSIQARGITGLTSGSVTWDSGGTGNGSAGWVPRVLDITSLVQTRYNQRIDRGYVASGGMAYTAIHDYIYNRRMVDNFDGSDDEPDKNVNFRYWDSSYGEWLNDPFHYPKLVVDEFPTIIAGDPYETDPTGRLSEVSDWDKDGATSPDASGYYTHHPRNLIAASGTDPSGAIPDASGYWWCMSKLDNPQYFACDLRAFPIENMRRNWRVEKGHWDCGNAICPNSNCAIGQRRQTVSEFIQWAQANGRGVMPTTTSTKCIYCGTDLTAAPASGAQYIGGDGILTVRYDSMPMKDVFITAVKLNPLVEEYFTWDAVSSQVKHDFFVEVKSSTDAKWRTLFKVEYLVDTAKWRYFAYNTSKTLTAYDVDTLPSVFYGKFTNSGNLDNITGADLAGAHFIVPFARHIRYRVVPSAMQYTMVGSSTGNLVYESYFSGNRFIPPSSFYADALKEDWTDGTLYFGPSGSVLTNPTSTYTILDSDATGVEVAGLMIPPSSTYWNIAQTRYYAGCSQFEVYGYDIPTGTVTLTNSAKSYTIPYVVGTASVVLPDFPTKILGVYSGIGDSAEYELSEVENTSSSSFYFTVEDRKNSNPTLYYKKVTGGSYVFDPSTMEIKLPTYWKDYTAGTTGSIWGLNADLAASGFYKQTIPQFIQVRYYTGIGVPLTLRATAIGEGPSYQVEKEAVCNIAGYEVGLTTPAGIPITDSTALPGMGNSVKFGSDFTTKKALSWHVYNHEPMKGEFQTGFLSGMELPGGGWSDSEIAKLFGGMTVTGVSPSGGVVGGHVNGYLTLYGPPDTIVSGSIYAYALAKTTRKYTVDGTDVVTYERTGGLKYNGFTVGVELDDVTDNRQGICFGLPTVLVYVKERDNTVDPSMT